MPQDARLATLAPRLKKEDGWLRLEEPARDLADRVRGMQPVAGRRRDDAGRAPADLAGRGDSACGGFAAGRARDERSGGDVPSPRATDCSCPTLVQPENKKAMAWEDFLRGARLGAGARVTSLAA